MATIDLDSSAFKDLIKEAIAESLRENREVFQEMITDALEDLALGEAIREGQQTELVSQDEILRAIKGSPCNLRFDEASNAI